MQPCCAHVVGQVDAGSQTSPHAVSTMPLPQTQLQSLSCAPVHPDGQQASPDTHVVCVPLRTQAAVQVAAEPCSSYVAQPTCGQLVGQDDGGSQVSPGSRRPLPQAGVPAVSEAMSEGRSRAAASLAAFSSCWTE